MPLFNTGGVNAHPFFASALIGAVLFASTPAQAQAVCDARAKIVKWLAENYQEQPRWRGVTARSLLMELFISPDETWTILVSQPNGISCLVASGDGSLEIPFIPDAPREKI